MPPRCFNGTRNSYGSLTLLYDALARKYPGWTLSEIRDLTVRERGNWFEILRWRRMRRVAN
jgi:hypothetical protein